MNNNKTLFNVRISPQDKELLRRLAAKEGRSMGNYIVYLIQKLAKDSFN